MKKILTLTLAVLMILSVFSGCAKDVTTPVGTMTAEEVKEFNKKAGGGNLPLINQVFFTNFSRHLGQVMAILPLPLGTRTGWRHLGQTK